MKIFRSFLICGLMLAAIPVFAQKLTADEVISRHLDSIGTAEKRASLQSLIAVGSVNVVFITQKNQPATGRIVLASSAEKYFFGLNLNAVDYPFERFAFDGKKTKVAIVKTSRTVLGNFVGSNDLMLEDSLLSGTLATSWALLNMADKKVKLSYDGTNTINGKETYAIGYSRKSGSDLDIKLFFDKETFRHVRTEYKRSSSAAMGRTIDQSARQSETRFKLTEDFSDFREESGLTLPHGYRLLYATTGQNGTTEIEWNCEMTEFGINMKLDENTFNIES